MTRLSLPAPIITLHDHISVVRDDLLPGGTKRRAMHVFFDDHPEYVYASPVYGYAQIALAYACRDYGKSATIFCAKRKTYAPLTVQAIEAGARIIDVPMGFLSHVSAKARQYCETTPGAKLLPFGLDDPAFISALADVARALPVTPTEVWSITSSGVLTRALQLAWPNAKFYGIRVGAKPDAGKAEVIFAPERFEQAAQKPPPFPSSLHYDAKAWRFVRTLAMPGALFWNVG